MARQKADLDRASDRMVPTTVSRMFLLPFPDKAERKITSFTKLMAARCFAWVLVSLNIWEVEA